ncbi:MAG TPA: hypothetical protein PKD03_15210, partial [Ignavibacteriaceae bacterium]|nr:hypothetical protein [Ignavibacteriaceae bacterium]
MKSIPGLTFLLVLPIVIIIQCNSNTFPSNYYVDKMASGQNNGTSWKNAWKSFSSINWSSIQPGDYIYISGGTDSLVYSGSLYPNKSG